MDNNSITPVMDVNGNNGLGGFGFIFAIIALLMFGGGGFGFGNNGNSNAIQNDINRGFDNQNLQAQTRDIMAAVNAQGAAGVAATNQTFHDMLMANQGLYNEVSRDIAALGVGQANLLARQNECCCELKQMVMQNNYDSALRDAATNANVTAQIQSVKDMFYESKIEGLQNQVNMLTTQNIVDRATAGVVRYPMGMVYATTNNPFCPGTSSGTAAA